MKRLKTVNARKNPSDARPLMPAATPCTNVEMTSGTDAFRLSVEVEAPESFMPRSCSQLPNSSPAAFA